MSLKTFLESDLDTFFNVDEFAEEVVFHLGVESTTVTVQFFDEESDLGDSIYRKLIVKVSDLPNLSKEGYFAVNDDKFKVIDFIADEQNLIFNVITKRGMR